MYGNEMSSFVMETQLCVCVSVFACVCVYMWQEVKASPWTNIHMPHAEKMQHRELCSCAPLPVRPTLTLSHHTDTCRQRRKPISQNIYKSEFFDVKQFARVILTYIQLIQL